MGYLQLIASILREMLSPSKSKTDNIEITKLRHKLYLTYCGLVVVLCVLFMMANRAVKLSSDFSEYRKMHESHLKEDDAKLKEVELKPKEDLSKIQDPSSSDSRNNTPKDESWNCSRSKEGIMVCSKSIE